METNTNNKHGQGHDSSSNKKPKPISDQEKKQVTLKLGKMADTLEHSEHMMKVLTSSSVGPNYWERDECKQIRESILFVNINLDKYPAIIGDQLPDGC